MFKLLFSLKDGLSCILSNGSKEFVGISKSAEDDVLLSVFGFFHARRDGVVHKVKDIERGSQSTAFLLRCSRAQMTLVFASKDDLLVHLEHLVNHFHLVLLRHLLDLVEVPLVVISSFSNVLAFAAMVFLVEFAIFFALVIDFSLEALHLLHDLRAVDHLPDAHA